MAVTIKDIARESGVSVATVSRICGNYGYASEEARGKVEKTCKKLGYTPNAIAKSMVKKQTKTIGLVVTDMHNEFYIKIIEEVEKNADACGYSIIFANSDESIQKEMKAIKTLVERQVDGILLVPVGQCAPGDATKKKDAANGHIRELIRLGIPVVFIDRYLEGVDVDAVLIENERVAHASACRLIDMGNRDICLVMPDQEISTILERKAGFLKALEDRGLEIGPERVLRCLYTSDSAFSSVTEFLARHAVDAFFALDYQMTLGVLMAIANSEGTWEKEIQVMGFDSLGNYGKLYPGKVISIIQPVAAMGKMAFELLIERIRNKGRIGVDGKRKCIRLSF